MPTDQVRGLKARGTSPAKTKLAGELLPLAAARFFPGQPCRLRGDGWGGGRPRDRTTTRGWGGSFAPHPEAALRAASDLSPQAGRGDWLRVNSSVGASAHRSRESF